MLDVFLSHENNNKRKTCKQGLLTSIVLLHFAIHRLQGMMYLPTLYNSSLMYSFLLWLYNTGNTRNHVIQSESTFSL